MKVLRVMALAGLLTLPTWSAGAEPRLFYTPAERARVTAERAAVLAAEALTGASVHTLVAPAASENLASPAAAGLARSAIAGPPRLEGVSLARDGRAHAWIGGRRYQDGDLFEGRRLRVMVNGVQLVGAAGPGRLLRVGDAMSGAARE